ncbi:MAG: chemotaxis-specific protein-glutamate methyltransferase CheB [Coriobacteriia bacterium]
MSRERPIRVVIVDDSLVPREMLRQILSSDPDIEVVGVARDGKEGVEMVRELRPDLVTMDIHMPVMDGLEATEIIMAEAPTPILVVSTSVHGEGIGRAFDALGAGALDVMKKPEPRDWEDMEKVGRDLISRVKLLSRVKVITHIRGKRRERAAAKAEAAADAILAPTGEVELVAVGSSTGGPSSLLAILGTLGPDFPVPIVIAQHIADGFVGGLAGWLNAASPLEVKVAEEGERLVAGKVYLSQTGVNLEVRAMRAAYSEPEPRQLYVPSVDHLFRSVLREFGKRAVGVILTGMGSDGAQALKMLKDVGAPTIAEDESTCTVFGMPKAAVDLGAAGAVLRAEQIATELNRLVGRGDVSTREDAEPYPA